jgi:hypothetical protein
MIPKGPVMGTKLLRHLRDNVVGYAAIVLVLALAPTSAYATDLVVRSADIVNGEVKTPDLATDAVRSSKILNGTIIGADLASDSVDSAKVTNSSLAGWDVADESLSGADIVESTLGQVPTALQGGLGRYGYTGYCDPETTAFVSCSTVQITLDKPARLLVIGTVRGTAESGASRYWGECRITTSWDGPVITSKDTITKQIDTDTAYKTEDNMSLIAVTNPFPAGTHTVGVECNQLSFGAIVFPSARIATVALSAG